MKVKYILFLFIVLSCFLSHAQHKTRHSQKISLEQYADLKQKGLLKPSIDYIIGGSQSQFEQIEANKKIAFANIEANKAMNKFSKVAANDSCACFQKVDSTYSIVPFTNGTAPDYRNDDGSSPLINFGGPNGFNFCFFGQTYNSCYINTNGNITFNNVDGSFSSTGFPTNSASPKIAPFWADVDIRSPISGLVRYKITPTYMIVTWDSVGYYDTKGDKRNTFQLVISNGTDSIVKGSGNVAFCYGDMQWTTGDASMGINGFGGTPATVGFDKGDAVKFAQLGRFDTLGLAYDGPGGNDDGVDWLDNKSFSFNTCASNNFPPVAVGSLGECNVVNMCNLNDTLYYEARFVGPEVGQIISMSANLPVNPISGLPISGFFVKSLQNGTTGKMIVGVINDGINTGTHFFSITGTDNGSPNQSSSVFFTVNLTTGGSACPNATIRGNRVVCKGAQTTLKKPLCGNNTGIWNTGSIIDSIKVSLGEYYYTLIDSLGCSKSYTAEVVQAPNSFPTIKGPDTLCTSSIFYYNIGNPLLFSTYQWQNLIKDTGLVVNANLIVDSLRLILTATNQFGCKEIKTKKIITVPEFLLSVPRLGADTAKKACPLEVSKYKAIPTTPPFQDYTYTWLDVNTNSEIRFTDTISVLGPKNIAVIVKKKNVCTLVKNIGIKPRPAIPVSITTNKLNNIICPIDTLKLSAVSNLYFAPFTYKWQPSLDSTKVITPKLDTTYTVTVKDAFACQGFKSFTIERLPNIKIFGEPFCKGDTTEIRVQSYTGYTSVQWTGQLATNLPNDTIIAITKADRYVATLIDANNCKMFDTLEVKNFFQPDFKLSTTATSPQLISGDFNLSLAITPYDQKLFDSFTWSFGDGKTSNTKKLELPYKYDAVEKYKVSVRLLDINGCYLYDELEIQIFDAIPEVNVFTPNGDAVNDNLKFKYLDLFPDNNFKVYDRWGRLAFEKSNYNNDWSPKDLTNGTYFYTLQINNATYNKKFSGYIELVR